jgi:hypothetical protein
MKMNHLFYHGKIKVQKNVFFLKFITERYNRYLVLFDLGVMSLRGFFVKAEDWCGLHLERYTLCSYLNKRYLMI